MMTPAEFVGDGRVLGPGDIAAAAAVLGVPPVVVRTVESVESNRRGFHPETHRPVILFEPHIFSKATKGRFDASHPDISYAARWSKPYPPSQELRYQQLFAAMALDEPNALSSTSWGLFQVMGYQHRLCGYTTVQDMVRGMVKSEGEQLVAFARFVGAQPAMVRALKARDWHAFAREYNGPAYAQHGYDQKLKAAYDGLQSPKAA